jgi:hypothetical protein
MQLGLGRQRCLGDYLRELTIRANEDVPRHVCSLILKALRRAPTLERPPASDRISQSPVALRDEQRPAPRRRSELQRGAYGKQPVRAGRCTDSMISPLSIPWR